MQRVGANLANMFGAQCGGPGSQPASLLACALSFLPIVWWANVHRHPRLPGLEYHEDRLACEPWHFPGPQGLTQACAACTWRPRSRAGLHLFDTSLVVYSLYMEAKEQGLLMRGEEKFKATMYSAILHMYARIQDFDTLKMLVADVREYSVHVKMNTLVVGACPACCGISGLQSAHVCFHEHVQGYWVWTKQRGSSWLAVWYARSMVLQTGHVQVLDCSSHAGTDLTRTGCMQMCVLYSVIGLQNDIIYDLLVNIRGQQVRPLRPS